MDVRLMRSSWLNLSRLCCICLLGGADRWMEFKYVQLACNLLGREESQGKVIWKARSVQEDL